MTFKRIAWWKPGEAYHVFNDDGKRIGIVNKRDVYLNGQPNREVWFAHNEHFFTVVLKKHNKTQREFLTRRQAAEAIPVGVIHQPASALSGSYD